jgi:2-polyprenyl-3-methyl-5-hydroxy-6-metoxy-1,4-benzoquinol methylase
MPHPLESKYGDVFRPVEGSWSGHDAVRHFMYEGLYSVLKDCAWEERGYRLLEFGTLEPTSSIIRMLVYILGERLSPEVCDYPAVDIQHLNDTDSTWDILVVDQVLEHVERPWLAAEEIYRTLKPGGYAIVNTPYLHPLHLCPLDCWRISPDGYKVLFPKEKWTTVGNGMWGNREIIEQIYHSPVSRGMTGDWLAVQRADQEVPSWRQATDGVNPIVIWNVFQKR